MRSSRRLEDQAQEELTEFGHLMNYHVKFLSCRSDTQWTNEQGQFETSSVVYRLCPADDCDCKKGYGDYVVGLNTFTKAHFEAVREQQQQQGNNNNNNNNNFRAERYAECQQYENRNKRGLEQNQANGYYIGPACSEGGSNVKFELFTEYTCTTVAEGITYEEMTNGYSLPANFFSSEVCTSCISTDNNGNSEPSDFCMDIYQWSGKCEKDMQYSGLYGKDESQCELLKTLVPKSSSGVNGSRVFWIIFLLAVVSGAAFFIHQRKSKFFSCNHDC